jgi:hypothetical protein
MIECYSQFCKSQDKRKKSPGSQLESAGGEYGNFLGQCSYQKTLVSDY